MINKCDYCQNRNGKNCSSCKSRIDSAGRDEVLKRLANNYGIPYNAKILNIVKASEKVLFKDLCRYHNVQSALANKITTNDECAAALENHLPVEQLLNIFCHVEPQARSIFGFLYDDLDYVYKYAGMIYGASIHASGTILSEESINIPISEGGCHANGHYCEELGYIKFDLLSLGNLDPIEEIEGMDVEWDNIDEKALDYIYNEDLDFVFQFGSPVVDNMIHGVSRDNINILTLSEITSTNRPGPLQIGLDRLWVKSQNGELPMQDEVTDSVKHLREKGLLKI